MQNLLDVAHCKNLEGLDVRQNSISNLDGVGNLCKLQVLQLDCNPVKSLLVLRPLSILPQLQTLSLEGSLLTAKIQPMQLKVLLRNLLPGAVLPFKPHSASILGSNTQATKANVGQSSS